MDLTTEKFVVCSLDEDQKRRPKTDELKRRPSVLKRRASGLKLGLRFSTKDLSFSPFPRGGGVLSYISYIGMCRPNG